MEKGLFFLMQNIGLTEYEMCGIMVMREEAEAEWLMR